MADQTGRHRTARHAIVLRGFRGLHQYDAALRDNLLEPERSITAGSRQDDADRPLALGGTERTKQVVHRQAMAERLGGIGESQAPQVHLQVFVGRRGVHVVGLHPHAVARLGNRHLGVAREQFCRKAPGRGTQVLKNDERKAAIGRQAVQEFGDRVKSPSRSTNRHDAKGSILIPPPRRRGSARTALRWFFCSL